MRKIDIKNFWDDTVGVWDEIQSVPGGFTWFAGNERSQYYSNPEKTEIIRVSDHWGSGILTCNWYLHGYERRNAFKWPDVCKGEISRMGKIEIQKLKDIEI